MTTTVQQAQIRKNDQGHSGDGVCQSCGAPPLSLRRSAPCPGRTKTHPLAPLVLALFEHTSVVDVTDVAYALAGALVRPSKGQKAYRIVAADVLGYLWHQGVLVRHGEGDLLRPADGGFWYTLAGNE